MERRTFIGQASLLGAGIPLYWLPAGWPVTSTRIDWLRDLVDDNDRQVRQLLERQVLDPSSPQHGGVPDNHQLYHAGAAAGFIQRLTASFVSPESEYYQNVALIHRMSLAIDFLLRIQHEDGSIDLITTNFHSTPDTGFVVEPLAISLGLLQNVKGVGLADLASALRKFLSRAGDILAVGGIHTPNHRWVVSMALARIHQLMPDPRYPARISEWVAEGIDIDADGQYTERSTSVYSPLTDRCLITISRLINRPQLLDPVRKNLDLTLYLLHPNGEIVTECSRRQDQYLARHPVPYYYPYLFLALRDRNATFYGLVDQLEVTLGAGELSGVLPYLLESPELLAKMPANALPDDYRRDCLASGMVHLRRKRWDATILKENAALVTFQHGSAVLQAVRVASAFFGKGQFIAATMEVTASTITLRQSLEAPYYQPIATERIDPDCNWENMPRDERPRSEVQHLEYRCEVRERMHGIQLTIELDGTKGVPLAIEFGFRKGGVLTGVQNHPDLADSYLWSHEPAFYRVGREAIQITGGSNDHQWTQLRGALPKLDAESLYFTGYTPFRMDMTIEAVDG